MSKRTLRLSRAEIPAGTWRKYNVASTSMQRHDVASTLRRRYSYLVPSMQRHDVASMLKCAWRKYNVASTSMQRHDVASTLRRRIFTTSWRCIDVEATLYLRRKYTSPQRRCNVMTLHRRWGDVIFTSCVRWDRSEPPVNIYYDMFSRFLYTTCTTSKKSTRPHPWTTKSR